MNHDTDTRRAPRRRVRQPVVVVDAMTGNAVGRLGNISESGMLLVADAPLVEDAVYQLEFALGEGPGRETIIDVGAHLQWTGPANTPGQVWMGLRFLTLSDAHRALLRQWMDTLGEPG
ncbi:MAG: PilZ domain-containing protein [Pseudoxanthomonas sp.]